MISASPKAAQSQFIRDINHVFKQDDDQVEGFHTPDFSAEIDTEEELITEEILFALERKLGTRLFPTEQIKVGDIIKLFARWHIEQIEQDRKNHSGHSRELFAKVISVLLQGHNHKPSLVGLACAGGLDQMNGIKSQAEAARENGGTRAIYSHWTTAWADYLSGKDSKFTITKFRKSESSRVIFKEKATDPFKSRRTEIIKSLKNQPNQNN